MSNKQFNDGFFAGVLVSLQTLKNHGQETCAVEIVRGIGGYEPLFDYANKQGNEVDLDTIAWLQNVATPQELSA
jgi:hypothetical protein